MILIEEKEIGEIFYLMILHSDEEFSASTCLLLHEFIKKNIDEIEYVFYDERIISKLVFLMQNQATQFQV